MCVVGEWRGHTGDDALCRRLLRDFRLEKRVALPNWTDTAHELTIWRRQSPEATGAEAREESSTSAAALKSGEARTDAGLMPRQPAASHDGRPAGDGGAPCVPGSAGEAERGPMQCWTCGGAGDAPGSASGASTAATRAEGASGGWQGLSRCRYCRDAAFCCAECAVAGEGKHRQAHALRLIFFGECQPEFDNDADYERLPALWVAHDT